MNEHEQWDALLPDYLSGLLDEEERRRFEAHLEECARCRKVVRNARGLKGGLTGSQGARLSPQGRLRLYERLNTERARRGEKLLRIPRELAAQARAKSQAAGEAAQEVARSGARSAGRMGRSGVSVAGAMGRGMKSVGGKAARTMGKGARRAHEMAAETAHAAADVGRIATEEVSEVIGDAMQSPFKAVLAPPRMAGKAAKMAARIAKGGFKVSMVGAKGMVEGGLGAAGVMGEMVRQQGKVARAMIDGAEEAMASSGEVAKKTAAGAHLVAKARPPQDDEME